LRSRQSELEEALEAADLGAGYDGANHRPDVHHRAFFAERQRRRYHKGDSDGFCHEGRQARQLLALMHSVQVSF